MENKYFIPDIEDIHIGYQYEIFQKGKPYDPNFMHFMPQQEEDTWIKMTYPDAFLGYDLKRMFEIYQIRVPYLTKEQIESEGWKYDLDQTDGAITFVKKIKGRYHELHFNSKKKEVLINYSSDSLRFKCKDINTFRKIIKLLGI